MTKKQKTHILLAIYHRMSPEQRRVSVPLFYKIFKSIYLPQKPKSKPKYSFSTIMKRLIAMDEEQQRDYFLAHGKEQPPVTRTSANNLLRRDDVRHYLQLFDGAESVNDESHAPLGPTPKETIL